MDIRTRFLAVTAIALAGVAPVPPAFARADHPAAEQSVSSYSDTELKSFAIAVLEVQRINNTYLPKLEAAATREEQEQVLQTASDEMTQVVEKNGLSVDRFTQILSHVQMDQGLAERIRKHMQETR